MKKLARSLALEPKWAIETVDGFALGLLLLLSLGACHNARILRLRLCYAYDLTTSLNDRK